MSIKIFDKWDTTGIKVQDPGLQRYINLQPIVVARTAGRQAKYRFYKSTAVNIVERLVNKLQVPGHRGKKHFRTSGHCTGKAARLYRTVFNVFLLIEKQLNKNPIEVFVRAIENAAPREEITAIEYGGARYPQAVECAPQRRVDFTLRMFVQGAYSKCFNTKIKLEKALSDEIIKAYNLDQSSAAIAKKLELERQADSAR
ncbi:MAG: 30S ribosomal protein S7 [Nanoarchaeota archaeon]